MSPVYDSVVASFPYNYPKCLEHVDDMVKIWWIIVVQDGQAMRLLIINEVVGKVIRAFWTTTKAFGA